MFKFEVLTKLFTEGTEEKHEKTSVRTAYLLARIFHSSHAQIRSSTHLTKKFGS